MRGMKKIDYQTAQKMTEDEWRRRLTPEQYSVLREGATEMPGSGVLLDNEKPGEYTCAACGALLFMSDEKYESTVPGLIGWPSFGDVAQTTHGEEAVILRDDDSLGVTRVEVLCRNCGSHLGHLFPDATSHTGQHYCINSCALGFTPN